MNKFINQICNLIFKFNREIKTNLSLSLNIVFDNSSKFKFGFDYYTEDSFGGYIEDFLLII